MRSLLLAASFPPTVGGIETLLYQTSRRLEEPPLVIAPFPATAAELCVTGVRDTFPVRAAYRPLWALHPSLHFLHQFWAIAARAAGRHRPRVILAGHIYLAPLARVLARRLRVPYVVCAYGQEVWRAGRPMGIFSLDQRLRGEVLRQADRVFVPGTFTASLLGDWRVDARRVVHVPYGADPRPVTTLPSGTTLLSVARLIPRKGIDTVIRAMRALPPDVTYRIVGSGADEPRLHQLAHSEGVADRVTFLGRVDDPTLAGEYRRAAIFVLPARRTSEGDLEGYGLVYFEAAAWGRPVVAGRSGGEIDAVLDGQTGLLVNGESIDAVGEAIRSLLADPARLAALGAAGRLRVETSHNWRRAAARIDAALADIA